MTVFVDEAVQGEFPPVCVRTGQPSDMVARLEYPQGGLGIAAVALVFLGPPGWVALALWAMLAGPGEYLVVRVPYADGAFRAEIRCGRIKLVALTAGVASLGLALAFQGLSQGLLWLVVAGTCFAVSLYCYVWMGLRQVRVRLDASRRWLTLSNVHADFVEATCAMPSRSGPARP